MEIRFSDDKYGMNWVRPDFEYGAVTLPQGFTSEINTTHEGDIYRTELRITNVTAKPIFTGRSDIAIAMPIEDRYERTDICLTSRSLVHVFCGLDVSWMLALRMGGEAPHLGLVFTQGRLDAYSMRHNGARANDRGCFLLHPAALQWAAGETKTWAWTIFPCAGKADFFAKLPVYAHRYVNVSADRYVLFDGETTRIKIAPAFSAVSVTADGKTLEPPYGFEVNADCPGEKRISIEADGVKTRIELYVLPKISALSENRVRFIAEHQQYHGEFRQLEGAYLAYDNDEDALVLTPGNDLNGGRERVGMGCLMARYLYEGGSDPDGKLYESLLNYEKYVLRELTDDTGMVYNDFGRDNSYLRRYNHPWFARFFLELYLLTKDRKRLEMAVKIEQSFYDTQDGARFYPIALPILELADALKEEKMYAELETLTEYWVRHAEFIAQTGIHYPPSEVAFEQSIIAPAADVSLQVYRLTGNARWLDSAMEHLKLLDLFCGVQPDWHLNETAVRNWDGYWFGKYKNFGDTFPHYWSALTGNCLLLAGEADRAETILRGVLPMIFPDGRAGCAYLFPETSNGVRCRGFDPRANDQDWALYFYLRAHSRR